MKTIHKYRLEPRNTQVVRLPAGATIINAMYQGDNIYMWALIDTEAPIVERNIGVWGTGHEINVDGKCMTHIDTVMADGYVFHVFELNDVGTQDASPAASYEADQVQPSSKSRRQKSS